MKRLARVLACVLLTVAAREARAHADEAPPVETPPVEAPPVETPPVEAPPATASASSLEVRAGTEVAAYLDSTATSVLTPSIGAVVANPSAGWALSGRYLLDVVSAASPDIVSTASPNFVEVRQAGNLGFRYKPSTFGVAASASTSYTPDYLSFSGGGQVTQEVDEKNLSLVAGYSYGHDTIGRTGTPFSVFSHTLQSHVLSLGASRVVNPGLVIGLFGDTIFERGDQSKPYRYIPIFSPETAASLPRGSDASAQVIAGTRLQARPLEQLPLQRERFALTARLAWRGASTTLRVEQRGYADSWGLRASTTDARYFIDVTHRITIWPHARFNIQNGVDFWSRAYSARSAHEIPLLRTGDRELGPLRTVGGGGGIRIALGKPGALEDVVFTATLDGYWTHFIDALYIDNRLSTLASTALEVAF